MKHISLALDNGYGLGDRMITQESNNFGDQILSLKELVIENNETYYKIIAITSRQEGDWMSLDEMRNWSNNVKTTKEIYEPRIK